MLISQENVLFTLSSCSEQLVLHCFYTDQLLCSRRKNSILHYGGPKSYLRKTLEFRGYFSPGSSLLSSSALFRDDLFPIRIQLKFTFRNQHKHIIPSYSTLLYSNNFLNSAEVHSLAMITGWLGEEGSASCSATEGTALILTCLPSRFVIKLLQGLKQTFQLKLKNGSHNTR